MFEIPGENPDEPETVKEFSAVILYQHSLNAYYKSEYQGGSNPPDCYSQAQFAVERALSQEEYSLISAMTEQVKTLSRSVGYEADDAMNIDPETGEVIEHLN